MMVIWMLHTFFTPFTMLMVWYQLSLFNSSIADVMPELMYFYLLLPLTLNLAGAWQGTFIANKIRTGELNLYLLKPISHIWFDITNNLAEKWLKTFILLPFIILSFIVFKPAIVTTPLLFAIAIVTLILGTVVNFILEQGMGYLAFWLDDISGLRNFKDIGFYTFGGSVLPVFLFPPLLKQWAVYMPFRYFGPFSVEIAASALTMQEIKEGLLVEASYVVFGSLVVYMLWQRGTRRFTAFGG